MVKDWSKTGCRTLRLDKVKDHEKSSQHREATQAALGAEEMETSTKKVYTMNETATQDAFKVLQHLIVNNYPLKFPVRDQAMQEHRLRVIGQILNRR